MKCVICGCDEMHACEGRDGPCAWALGSPPVCTSCIHTFIIARLWEIVGRLTSATVPKGKRSEADDLWKLQNWLARQNLPLPAEMPSMEKLGRINRKIDRHLVKMRARAVA